MVFVGGLSCGELESDENVVFGSVLSFLPFLIVAVLGSVMTF